MISPLFSKKLKNVWVTPKQRRIGTFYIFPNLGPDFQPVPIDPGTYIYKKQIIGGSDYFYLEAQIQSTYNKNWTEVDLVGEKSFGRSRVPYKQSEIVPIPKFLFEPHSVAELVVYIHVTESTGELIQALLSYSIVEVEIVDKFDIKPGQIVYYID